MTDTRQTLAAADSALRMIPCPEEFTWAERDGQLFHKVENRDVETGEVASTLWEARISADVYGRVAVAEGVDPTATMLLYEASYLYQDMATYLRDLAKQFQKLSHDIKPKLDQP